MNVLKNFPHRIWIVNGDKGFWKKIHYENVPKFCGDCMKTGHASGDCAGIDLGIKDNHKLTVQIPMDRQNFLTEKLPVILDMALNKNRNISTTWQEKWKKQVG